TKTLVAYLKKSLTCAILSQKFADLFLIVRYKKDAMEPTEFVESKLEITTETFGAFTHLKK
ncbi:unnamed protein product, partial [Larinioides sclopetarius]